MLQNITQPKLKCAVTECHQMQKPFISIQIIVMTVFSGLSLTCHLAEYQIGNECCPKCPPGKNQLNDECMCFSEKNWERIKKESSE